MLSVLLRVCARNAVLVLPTQAAAAASQPVGCRQGGAGQADGDANAFTLNVAVSTGGTRHFASNPDDGVPETLHCP